MKIKKCLESILFLFILYLCGGCSSLLYSQGYRLDSGSKTSDLKNFCTSDDTIYKGALVNSSAIKMALNLDTRVRVSLLGPPLIPFIPIGFGQDKNVSVLVSTDLSGERIQSDFKLWQFSADGRTWLKPIEIKNVKFNSEGTYVIERNVHDRPNQDDTFAVQLIFDSKMKNIETAFIRTSEVSLADRRINAFVSKWNREDYWSYTPFIGGMDGHFSSMMDCKR
jgi:hypothetical protein